MHLLQSNITVHSTNLPTREQVSSVKCTYSKWKFKISLNETFHNYGRPLSVSGRPYYILPMFVYLFLWPPYSPALVNESSRKFYTWWTLSVIRKVIAWIFSWSSLNYRVGQKVTKFGVFSCRTRKLSALTPERSSCNSEKKLVKHRWLLYT